MQFISEYNHTIDKKGRLIVPVKFREGLGESFVVTRGIDACLFVYSSEEWQKVVDKLTEFRITNKKAREFTRFLLGGATEVEVDSMGRILIPAYLRDYGKMLKDIVLVGMGNHIEIWSKENYEGVMSETDIEEIAGELDEAGIWL